MADFKNTIIVDDGYLQLPVGTTAQRPGSPVNGDTRFNSQFKVVETYVDGAWKYMPPIVEHGLVLHLDAAEPASYSGSGTTWYDLSGNQNDGTLVNGPTYSSSNADSIVFDGVDDYWICNARTTTTEFQYSDAFTVGGWAYINENSETGYICNNRFTDANGTLFCGWGIMHTAGYINFAVGGYPSNTYDWRFARSSTTTFNNYCYQKWAYIIAVNTGVAGEQKIYINGINLTDTAYDDATPPYTINYSNGNSRLNVGRDGVVAHYLNSNISNIQVYNRALSAAEIQQNFNALRGRYSI